MACFGCFRGPPPAAPPPITSTAKAATLPPARDPGDATAASADSQLNDVVLREVSNQGGSLKAATTLGEDEVSDEFDLPPKDQAGSDDVSTVMTAISSKPDAIAINPGAQINTVTNSLKLQHGNTLNQLNINLCKPEELVGDIKDLSFIGNGSFAAVFKGSWKGAKVAVKFVLSNTLNSNSVTLRESVLSQLLSHPNVIQTYTTRCALMDDESLNRIHAGDRLADPRNHTPHFNSGDGFGDPRQYRGKEGVSISSILLQLGVKPGQYLAVVIMEYADKGTLQEAIYKRAIFKENSRWHKRIAARALFRTAREIAIGMQHLHNCNVLHGDLKPGNVLLTSARVDRRGFIAKLADFGLSHVAMGPIATSSWGTVRYMAPEHFQGTMSQATDVYSFGTLLWELVAGKKPYEDMQQGEIISSVTSGLRPSWPADCFPNLEYLGKRCLAHNPEARPSFTEIVQELEDMEVMLRDLLQASREGPPVSGERSESFTAAIDLPQKDGQPALPVPAPTLVPAS